LETGPKTGKNFPGKGWRGLNQPPVVKAKIFSRIAFPRSDFPAPRSLLLAAGYGLLATCSRLLAARYYFSKHVGAGAGFGAVVGEADFGGDGEDFMNGRGGAGRPGGAGPSGCAGVAPTFPTFSVEPKPRDLDGSSVVSVGEEFFEVGELDRVLLAGFVDGGDGFILGEGFAEVVDDFPVVVVESAGDFHFAGAVGGEVLVPFGRVNEEALAVHAVDLVPGRGRGSRLRLFRPRVFDVLVLVGEPGQLAGAAEIAGGEEALQVAEKEFVLAAGVIHQRAGAGLVKGVADEADDLPVGLAEPGRDPDLLGHALGEVLVPLIPVLQKSAIVNLVALALEGERSHLQTSLPAPEPGRPRCRHAGGAVFQHLLNSLATIMPKSRKCLTRLSHCVFSPFRRPARKLFVPVLSTFLPNCKPWRPAGHSCLSVEIMKRSEDRGARIESIFRTPSILAARSFFLSRNGICQNRA